jgi:hypothetical protein
MLVFANFDHNNTYKVFKKSATFSAKKLAKIEEVDYITS